MFQNQMSNGLTKKCGYEYGDQIEWNYVFHQYNDNARLHQLIYNSLHMFQNQLYLPIAWILVI